MDIWDQLYPAEYRGVPFHMLDAGEETGRRIQRTLFPGRDDTWHEDMGALDGGIRVQGIIIGEDYVRRARRMRLALRTPGPGLLTHPWLGDMDVVLNGPGELSFQDREIRLARFTATFEPWLERPPEKLDTLGLLLALLDAVREAVRAFLNLILAPLRLVAALVGAVAAFASSVIGMFRGAIATVRGATGLGSVLLAPFAGLSGVGALDPRSRYAPRVYAALAAPSAAVRLAGMPAPVSALAPYTPVVSAPILPAASAVRVLLAVAAGMGTAPVALAARCLVLADAAALGARVPFAARDEALAMLALLDDALAALGDDLAVAAAADPAGAGALWRAVDDARLALARDLHEQAGRLPATSRLLLPRAAPTWLVAQHLAGDTPTAVAAQHAQLVGRNALAFPGRCPAGAIEVLR